MNCLEGALPYMLVALPIIDFYEEWYLLLVHR
jgi:hypothetical protein